MAVQPPYIKLFLEAYHVYMYMNYSFVLYGGVSCMTITFVLYGGVSCMTITFEMSLKRSSYGKELINSYSRRRLNHVHLK